MKSDMPTMRRSATTCMGVLLLFTGNAAAAPYSRFGYCPPPTPPACVATAARKPNALVTCEQEVERYVATVFAYRACMAAETERAVRESNEIIRKMRCAREPANCTADAFAQPAER